ncbi:MAG: hypothetical protein J3K34DRAFT_447688 [Monoraphidium minutum]|nr:MAG: hypothetical protein J3K34DRAFT_447688 [Monoraphidium minutum]
MAGNDPQLLREDVLEPVIAVLARQAAGGDGEDAAHDAAEARRALRATCRRCCAAVDAACEALSFCGPDVCTVLAHAAARPVRRPRVRRVQIMAPSDVHGHSEASTLAADVAEAYCSRLETLDFDHGTADPLLLRLAGLAAAGRLPRLTMLELAAARLSVSIGGRAPLEALAALTSLSLRGRIDDGGGPGTGPAPMWLPTGLQRLQLEGPDPLSHPSPRAGMGCSSWLKVVAACGRLECLDLRWLASADLGLGAGEAVASEEDDDADCGLCCAYAAIGKLTALTELTGVVADCNDCTSEPIEFEASRLLPLLPRIRRLTLYTSEEGEYGPPFAAVCGASLQDVVSAAPALEALALTVTDERPGAALAGAPRLPRLRELHLSGRGDAFAAAPAPAPGCGRAAAAPVPALLAALLPAVDRLIIGNDQGFGAFVPVDLWPLVALPSLERLTLAFAAIDAPDLVPPLSPGLADRPSGPGAGAPLREVVLHECKIRRAAHLTQLAATPRLERVHVAGCIGNMDEGDGGTDAFSVFARELEREAAARGSGALMVAADDYGPDPSLLKFW